MQSVNLYLAALAEMSAIYSQPVVCVIWLVLWTYVCVCVCGWGKGWGCLPIRTYRGFSMLPIFSSVSLRSAASVLLLQAYCCCRVGRRPNAMTILLHCFSGWYSSATSSKQLTSACWDTHTHTNAGHEQPPFYGNHTTHIHKWGLG